MSKHTPGPWIIDGNGIKTSISAGSKHIAMVNYWHVGGADDVIGEEHEANARLIAAAPDLLKALHRIVDAEEIDSPSYQTKSERIARAAIAKAEEGQG